MRPIYTEYVRHCLRFYCKHPDMAVFRTEVDERNWRAVSRFLKDHESYHDLIEAVYGSTRTTSDVVQHLADEWNCTTGYVWEQLRYIESAVAKERGLQ